MKEYQDVFSQDYKYLKGLVEEMGEMKIELILGENNIWNVSNMYHISNRKIGMGKSYRGLVEEARP
jgi:hypothetical protein